ncbi:FAD-dependent oxidoreductase [Oceanobacillus manasiensis]|uniref:FAD-dependent oxidoreductase n=1 Tax=Oceanobacillus manasiensis TaxID=586413 RepID=UPI0005A706FC|nr:FAD-dependent oxidoreductase [Oceanobacillus manasiensis]
MREENANVVVLGGSLGGCMAALSVAKMGFRVILTEETDWLGGQLTSQAVPPDEHKWIEEFGATASYREFRQRVRNYYKENYPLTTEALSDDYLNPGNGWVSRLAHEPKVALSVLSDMLAPYINSGKIRVLYGYKPHDAELHNDIIESVIVQHLHTNEKLKLVGTYILDATECGDVLPLAKVEYVVGAESKQETGEPHAREMKDPLDTQAITYVFAVDYVKGENFTIDKPEQYEFWKNYVPSFSSYSLLDWHAVNAADTTTLKEFTMFPNNEGIPSLFTYRRILDVSKVEEGLYDGDISLINWPQNDYFLGSILNVTDEERKKHLKGAKELSLSLLYWLQTEAPRLDGGRGFPGLRLRKDVLGTEDGFAKYPYIRESRRIKALQTITEMDVSKEERGKKGIRKYKDSVGIGCYHLDLHHTTNSNRAFYIPSYPFEIPLGALLTVRVKNLLPACKNIGTTHITNGCCRLHPVEWNIGEAAGFLAGYAMLHNISTREIRDNPEHLKHYQDILEDNGVALHWPEGMEV